MKLILNILTALSLLLILGCSLRGEDVNTRIQDLRDKMNPYQYDETYIVETKKLRDGNQKSLMAHVAYITARGGSKTMLAEYKRLLSENKSAFYEYLVLRAELSFLSYRDMAKRNEVVEKLEKLALENEFFKAEGIFDLCSGFYLLRDKKKKRKYVEELLKKKPNYRPYQKLMALNFNANDEAKDIIRVCEKELKGPHFDSAFCRHIEDLNEDNAKELLTKRDELLELMVEKALKNKFEFRRDDVWNTLHAIGEAGSGKAVTLKKSFTEKVLNKDPKWLPRESYRLYYGEDIDYQDFEFILKVGKLHKEIDFDKRVNAFEGLLKQKIDKKKQSQLLSGLGHAYLNPANQNKEKAFKYFVQANEYEALGSYSTGMLLDLILELNKDPDIGLMIVEDRLETVLSESQKNLDRDRNIDDFIEYSKSDLASYHAYRGRFFLKKKQEDKARLAFLESFQMKEGELSAYFLAELYKEKNPLVAIDFLGYSIKSRDSRDPMSEELSKKRDALFKKLYHKYYGKKLKRSELLAVYEDKNEKESKKDALHAFIGKPLVTDKLADFRGGDYDWDKLKGKKVILSFWATWCTPCFQEMAVLNKLHKEGKIKDLKIVGVCTDGIAQKKKVAKILKNGGIEFDILLDDGTFKNKYLVAAIPSMFFLDKTGKYIKQKTGYSPKLEEEILKLFK